MAKFLRPTLFDKKKNFAGSEKIEGLHPPKFLRTKLFAFFCVCFRISVPKAETD